MRITNNIIRSNTMLHIQKNKATANDYFQQFSSQKKIQKPSDNPTIAVRALKYRTTLVEIEQYLSNCDEAENWMDATEEPLKKADSILDTMIDYVTQAANGTNKDTDRATIAAQLKQYCDFIYQQNANMDYAGRYLFTGYRTDVPLLFEKESTNVTYVMKEELKINNIQKYNYVYGQPEYADDKAASDYAKEASEYLETHRILLSYDNCDARDVTITYTDAAGKSQTVTAVTKSIANNKTYNEQYHPAANEINYVPETGELILGDDIYDSIRAGSDLKVEYSKTNFETNDIRPEHYFECTATDNVTGTTKNYFNIKEQKINYQINFSQTITVNTLGCNAFDTSMGRAVDDIYNVLNNLDVMDQTLVAIQKRIDDCNPNDTEKMANLKELYNRTETEISLQNTVLTNAYAHSITVFQNAKDTLNVALAEHGSRYNRLKMTSSKLEVLQTDTKESKSENEDADLEEAYVNYTQADLLYQASLQATGKILGTSLLNFI